MSIENRKFISRAVMFADGDKGAAKQVHEILEGDLDKDEPGRPLGIKLVWSRERGADPGTRFFTFDGKHFATFADALAASDATREATP